MEDIMYCQKMPLRFYSLTFPKQIHSPITTTNRNPEPPTKKEKQTNERKKERRKENTYERKGQLPCHCWGRTNTHKKDMRKVECTQAEEDTLVRPECIPEP